MIDLYETWPGEPVGTYNTKTKTLELFRKSKTMLYANIDWIVVVGQFQINPLRHAPAS